MVFLFAGGFKIRVAKKKNIPFGHLANAAPNGKRIPVTKTSNNEAVVHKVQTKTCS